MPRWLTPARRHGVEVLDDPATPDDLRLRAMRDVARANALFGGTRAVIVAMRDILPTLGPRAVLLDVGTGMGDIPHRARRDALRRGVEVTTIGLDRSASLLTGARARLSSVVAGDALRLPVRDRSADVAICSQLLHHFAEDDARRLIGELHRVSRGWVVIGDLRRSWLAASGFWAASGVLGFHPVTRRDGLASVFRGFQPAELRRLVTDATGVVPRMRRGIFWRLSATWHTAR